jgi:SAM-dependent methyltransferase
MSNRIINPDVVYDGLTPYYDLLMSGTRKYHEEILFFDSLGKKLRLNAATDKILDLGSATGEYVCRFRKAGWLADGVDISPKMVKMAKEKCPEADFYCGNFLEFEPPKRYDIILASNSVIAFLLEDWELEKFFQKMTELEPKFLIVDFGNHDSLKNFEAGRGETRQKNNENYEINYRAMKNSYKKPIHAWQTKYQILDKKSGEKKTLTLDNKMRLYETGEVTGLAQKYFDIRETYGNYDFSPMTGSSPKRILICAPKA